MVATAIVLVCPGAASAAAGDLDPSFSGDGIATTGVLAEDASVAIDSRGRIVVSGGFYLVRFMPNGTLDESFAGDGQATPPFDGLVTSVAVDAQDRIVLAGDAPDPRDPRHDTFAVGRLRPNGTPDPSFSGDGQVVTPIGGTQTDQARAVAIDGQGRIVAAGLNFKRNPSLETLFALVRYLPNGSPDPSFSGDGQVTTRFPNVADAFAEAVALDSKGRIVAAGTGDGRFAIARYTPGGGLDPSFSGDGTATTAMAAVFSSGYTVALDDTDRIVVGGSAATSQQPFRSVFALARYRPNGALDSSFSGDGKGFTSFGRERNVAYGVAIDDQQRIIAGGSTFDANNSRAAFALARYTSSGALDRAFSGDGRVTTSIGPRSWAQALALDPRGKIVAAGYTARASGGSPRFAVARYLSG